MKNLLLICSIFLLSITCSADNLFENTEVWMGQRFSVLQDYNYQVINKLFPVNENIFDIEIASEIQIMNFENAKSTNIELNKRERLLSENSVFLYEEEIEGLLLSSPNPYQNQTIDVRKNQFYYYLGAATMGAIIGALGNNGTRPVEETALYGAGLMLGIAIILHL